MKTRSSNANEKAATKAKKPKEAKENVIESGELPPPEPEAPKGFRALSSTPKGWSKVGEALDRVRAVRTIFPDFNRATRVGGLPLRRIVTLHGPTHGGKSAFVAGLLRSFIDAGHVGAYVDAEHATDLSFLDQLFERRVDDIPNFLAKRPDTYEDTIDAIDEFLTWMQAERKARGIKPGQAVPETENLAAFIVLDSINKLVPAKEMERLRKEGGDAIDKGWGRLRAAFNQSFLDHVVPLLGKAETSLGIIVQERDDDDLDPWEMPKLKGGKATQYDASLIVRVMKGAEVKKGEGESKESFGFRHRLRIWKSKVGHMDGRWSDAAFHMSNGNLVRPGFDTARDAIEVGKELGIVQASGSWLSWGKKRWQGEHNAVIALTKDADALAALLDAIATKEVRGE